MSYLINKTDGTLLTEIVDGTLDQLSTNLTLIGKNSSAYGESLNENFVRLLENFSSDIAPTNPIRGQLWYDITESRLKVYDGTAFKLSGSTIVSDSMPSSISRGDLWIDSKNHQLYFNDGITNWLAGPIDSPSNGIAVESVIDDTGESHNIIRITISPITTGAAPVLLAIFSITEFTLNTPIDQFEHIRSGFNFLPTTSSSITNIIDPIDDTDVVNLRTLTNSVKLTPLAISLNTTAMTGNKSEKMLTVATDFLSKVFPADEHAVADIDGPICRVVATDNTTVTVEEFKMIESIWQHQTTL
jgi:hypothetical protein